MKDSEYRLDALKAELRYRELALEVLHELDRRILIQDDIATTLHAVVEGARTLTGADAAHILLRRGTILEVASSTSTSQVGSAIPLGGSVLSTCFARSEVLLIPHFDARVNHLVHVETPRPFTVSSTQSLLAVPIVLSDAVLGVIICESPSSNAFTPPHVATCNALATEAALAIAHAHLFEREASFTSLDQLVFSESIGEELLESVLAQVAAELLRLRYVAVEAAQILFVRPADGQLEVVHSTVPENVGLVIPVDHSVCGRALRERRTVTVNDTDASPYGASLRSAIHSEIAIPIVVGDQDLSLGVINVASSERDAFSGVPQVILERFARSVTTLLAFMKLRADLTDMFEIRHANQLMLALGDQTSNVIHRLNNTLGAMRFRIAEIESSCAQELDASAFLRESIASLRASTDEALAIPEQALQFLTARSDSADLNVSVRQAVQTIAVPSGIELVLDLQEPLELVKCYSLDLVVTNLVQNAVEALSDGGTITVCTRAKS